MQQQKRAIQGQPPPSQRPRGTAQFMLKFTFVMTPIPACPSRAHVACCMLQGQAKTLQTTASLLPKLRRWARASGSTTLSTMQTQRDATCATCLTAGLTLARYAPSTQHTQHTQHAAPAGSIQHAAAHVLLPSPCVCVLTTQPGAAALHALAATELVVLLFPSLLPVPPPPLLTTPQQTNSNSIL